MSTIIFPSHPAPGTGGGYWTGMENWMDAVEEELQDVEDRIEAALNQLFGQGVLTGSYAAPLLSIGAGLSVAVAAHVSIIGLAVVITGATVISPIPASQAIVYLWEYQDNDSLVPHYGTTLVNVNPSLDPENPAILIGTCVSGVATITSVNDAARTEVLPPAKGRIELQYTAGDGGAWDAAADRTGGTGSHYQITLPWTPASGTVLEVYTDRQRGVRTYDWSIAAAVISLLDGFKPLAGEILTVLGTPA